MISSDRDKTDRFLNSLTNCQIYLFIIYKKIIPQLLSLTHGHIIHVHTTHKKYTCHRRLYFNIKLFKYIGYNFLGAPKLIV